VDLARDRDLVERYQAGDPRAFDDLYERYFPRLRQYCQRRVGDAHEAEELAQEAFIRAFRALPAFAGERRFYPWMTVIAQRLCVDHHRRLWRVTPAPDVDPGGTADEGHDALFERVDLDHLATALTRLAPRHREILQLREHEGWSYQRIADHLEVPITTVEALLHRARKALRREFSAVAGHGRLAGIPIAGWIMRNLGDLKTRVATRIGDRLPELGTLATPVAAGAVTLALAVGPVIGTGGTGPATPPTTSVAGRAASTTTAAPAPVAAPPTTASRAGRATSAAPPSSTTQPPPAPSGSGGDGATVGPAKLNFNDDGSEAASHDKVVPVGPVTVGVTPRNVAASIEETVQDPGSVSLLAPGGDR
jgi:RNA polymerase sigma-70 factor (ECF subfamily)